MTVSISLPPRPPFKGLRQIFQFNWPWYALAIAGNLIAVTLLHGGLAPLFISRMIVISMGIGNFWLIASLAVSHYIYDYSAIARSEWLEELPQATVRQMAAFHAGQDEASPAMACLFPAADLHIYDFFDPHRNTESSILRARALAQPDERTILIRLDAIPLEDAWLDLACVVFAAHEIRSDRDRATFFCELRRVLKTGGQLIVVEHLRDSWNLLAFGPGAFHFLPRKTWLETFSTSGWGLAREIPCTPFVRVFHFVSHPC